MEDLLLFSMIKKPFGFYGNYSKRLDKYPDVLITSVNQKTPYICQ